MRGPADRAGSALHRAALAGYVALVLLSRRDAKRLHALGALDLALWDIKGKVHGLPVHALLGGMVRNYCECYNTAGIIPAIKPGMSIRERARATIEAGYRAFRMGAADVRNGSTYNTRERLNQVLEGLPAGARRRGRERRFLHRLPPALRPCGSHSRLRADRKPRRRSSSKTRSAPRPSSRICRFSGASVKVPLAAGEEWGNRWDFNRLVEDHDIDFLRATLPNVGGITEMVKVAAICETHFVGIVPHFTGPIATAALVNTLGTFSGPVLMEYNFEGRTNPQVPVCLDFKQGKLYPNDRPGLGVELDMKQLKLIAEVTEPIRNRQLYYRPDGSITNW